MLLLLVADHGGLLRESLAAHWAGEPLPGVQGLVPLEGAGLGEGLAALATGEGLAARVRVHVVVQTKFLCERFAAGLANMGARLFTYVQVGFLM